VFLEEGLSPGPEDFVSMEGMLRNGFQKPTKNPLRKRKGGFFNLKPETRNPKPFLRRPDLLAHEDRVGDGEAHQGDGDQGDEMG